MNNVGGGSMSDLSSLDDVCFATGETLCARLGRADHTMIPGQSG